MEKEWKANARGAGAKGQYEIRKSIIRMLLDGKSGQETAKLLGVSEGHVSNVRKLYPNFPARNIHINFSDVKAVVFSTNR